jgi:hypothetical protein
MNKITQRINDEIGLRRVLLDTLDTGDDRDRYFVQGAIAGLELALVITQEVLGDA